MTSEQTTSPEQTQEPKSKKKPALKKQKLKATLDAESLSDLFEQGELAIETPSCTIKLVLDDFESSDIEDLGDAKRQLGIIIDNVMDEGDDGELEDEDEIDEDLDEDEDEDDDEDLDEEDFDEDDDVDY